jgi:nitrite reductase (NADH) large subunit
VCGATRKEFEPFVEETPVPAAKGATKWQCLVCNHLHEGPEPPGECPVCGAPKDRFEPIDEKAGPEPLAQQPDGIVVVGGGIAGVSAVEAIRAASPTLPVTLISKEPELPYHRLNLTRFVAGEIEEASSLALHPAAWYDDNNIQLLRGHEVAALSPDRLELELRTGERLRYGKLILTAGSHPLMLPIPGVRKEGVTAFRTLGEAQYILEELAKGAKCVCIGGGILGLESAAGLARRGADVTILEGFEWLLPRQLNPRGGRILEGFVRQLGIDVRPGALTKEILGDERVRSVQLEDGTQLDADLVVVAVGIRTNSFLARRAGLEVNNGVLVDDRLTTSAPDILAAGDVAEHRGVVAGLWGPAQYQGTIAGMNAVGKRADYGGIPRATTMKVVGLPLFSVGEVKAEDASYRDLDEEGDGTYSRFLFRDNRLVGAILLGDASLAAATKKCVEARTDLSGLLGKRPTAAEVAEHLAALAG